MSNLTVSVRVSNDSLNKTILGVVGFLLFITVQMCVDIPGVDLPDVKDLPEWVESLG